MLHAGLHTTNHGALQALGDVFVEQEFSEPKFFLNQSVGCQHFPSGDVGRRNTAYCARGVFWVVTLKLPIAAFSQFQEML